MRRHDHSAAMRTPGCTARASAEMGLFILEARSARPLFAFTSRA
ncbi:hypothetical protein G9444_1144 [Rhodococcus erythropolis]|uniref:Uncharacterized protein n=1 Tax=Rhodococcus erythropolis TaxID=1833 RepID=A0A6G9CNC5_RHOER|nr:hypothetical protein G9444_1144 [Rhodococcus erythropolis]